MKLKRFKERDNKKIGVIVFTLVCLFLISGAILYRTFAIFEVRTNQNVIKGKVGDMGDIQFAFYIDDKIVKESPKVNEKEKYVFDEENSNCTNEASVYWDYQQWAPYVLNLTQTKTKCYLKFKTEYNEEILNGAVPKIEGELIPVTIDENGTVRKADITTEWYKYGERRWANAVIFEDEVEDNYEPNAIIDESDIESYFVWIPRYKYQIWNGEEETSQFNNIEDLGTITSVTEKPELDKAKEIKIEFENKHMPVSNGNLKNQWLTHPAFISFESNGFWVGKFETGYKGATSIEEAQNAENTNKIDTSKVIIKPNVYSWSNIQVANAFYTSYNYQRDLDSHMMKNMEWGAVAYLTNSQYGRCPDGKCTEVRINNNSAHITGSSAANAPICGYIGDSQKCNQYGTDANIVNSYTNQVSVISSTTNNYYGIYDMSGGAWEYVFGFLKNESGSLDLTSLGFNNFLEEKYYDSYDYNNSNQNYTKGHLGDGTKEFGPFYQVVYSKMTRQVSEWNADVAFFVDNTYPWFIRGGSYADGSETGVGAFSYIDGNANIGVSFRIVLTP